MMHHSGTRIRPEPITFFIQLKLKALDAEFAQCLLPPLQYVVCRIIASVLCKRAMNWRLFSEMFSSWIRLLRNPRLYNLGTYTPMHALVAHSEEDGLDSHRVVESL